MMYKYKAPNFTGFTPLQKAPSSRWGLNAFYQSRDVAFWKGASGSCNLKVIFDRRGSTTIFFEEYKL